MLYCCQTPSLLRRLGVEFVLPLSQERQETQEQQQGQEPPHQNLKKCIKSLTFGTQT